MAIEQEQKRAAAEIADRHFQRGQLSGMFMTVGVTAPVLLSYGGRASISTASTLHIIAAEGLGLAAIAIGCGFLRRRQLRAQQMDATPKP